MSEEELFFLVWFGSGAGVALQYFGVDLPPQFFALSGAVFALTTALAVVQIYMSHRAAPRACGGVIEDESDKALSGLSRNDRNQDSAIQSDEDVAFDEMHQAVRTGEGKVEHLKKLRSEYSDTPNRS